MAASFDLPKDHPARAVLAEQALDDEDVLTLRRLVGADGRGRAFVNDQPVSVALLRRLGDTLVEIQGQMEQHGLLDMATHRASLDAFAGLEKQGDAVRLAWRAWRAAEQARADAEAAAAAARRDEDFLRHAVKELEALAPKPDDEETLAGERQLLRAGSALGEAVTQALAELEQGRGAVTALRTAHRLIERNVDKAMGRLDARAGGARAGAERGDRGAGPARGRARCAGIRSGAAGEDRGAAVRPARRRPQAQRRRARARRPGRQVRRPAGGARRRRGRAEAPGGRGEGRARRLCRRRRGCRRRPAARARRGSTRRSRPSSGRSSSRRPSSSPISRRCPRPSGPRPAPTACSSRSPPIPARRPRRSPASPRAASCRASCWR